MADGDAAAQITAPRKFTDPETTASGAPRAHVAFDMLDTLWVNTGTLCNIECAHCYIESSPSNDRLAYFTRADLAPLLAEAKFLGAAEIGFTGGEPFMNPDIIAMADDALTAGFDILILTNAMRPAMRPHIRKGLRELHARFGARMNLRVSLDHYAADRHDQERGGGSFDIAAAGVDAFVADGFSVSIAGRTLWGESEQRSRAGFAALFAARGWPIDAGRRDSLVLFPELDETADTPEITAACWDILGKSSADMMCASSRMAVKRKGADRPVVLACTLIPYDAAFEMGATLAAAARSVTLNHPHCAKFCVLGGASCSAQTKS